MHSHVYSYRGTSVAQRKGIVAYMTQKTGAVIELTEEAVEKMSGYFGLLDPNDPRIEQILGERYAKHEGVAIWHGPVCQALDLTEGAVATTEEFENVLAQLHPRKGTKLPSNQNYRAAIRALEVQFDLEKDPSVLMAMNPVIGRIGEAALEAGVAAALAYGDGQAGVVRRGKQGLVHRQAGGLLTVLTRHAMSRPVDGQEYPHAHIHALVMNLAEGPDGKWTALDTERLYKISGTMGAIAGEEFRRRFADGINQLVGEEIIAWTIETSPAGTLVHRIVGFDDALRERLSPRHRQIIEKMQESGIDDQAAQLATREGKGTCGNDPVALGPLLAELAEDGITNQTLLQALGAEVAQKQNRDREMRAQRAALIERLGPVPEDRLQRRDWCADAAQLLVEDERSLSEHVLARSAGKPQREHYSQAYTLASLPDTEPTREEKIHDALEAVGRANSTWRPHHLITALCNLGLPLAEAEAEAARWIDAGHAVNLYGIDERKDPLPGTLRARTKDERAVRLEDHARR